LKKIDETTKFLMDSLPENLRALANTACENGFLSQLDFENAMAADEIPDEEHDETLSFFQQDLGLEVLEAALFDKRLEQFTDEESEAERRDIGKMLDSDAEQVDVGDELDEHYAKQLERSSVGTIALGIQDSVQSYLKSIGTVQLLTAAGEIAIAQRIEAANKLLIYGLCESPMTIRAMLEWHQQLLNEEVHLRYVVNLEVMYSSDSEKKSLAQLVDTLKSKGVEDVDALDDEDLDDAVLEDAAEEEEEEDVESEDAEEAAAEKPARGSSGVPIPVMEEAVMPQVMELFAKIKKIFAKMEKMQQTRVDNLMKTSKLDERLEKEYAREKLRLYECVNQIRLNDDRISEILEKLTARNALLMGLEGKLLRLATTMKVKRDDFIREYSGNELNRNWVRNISRKKESAWQKFAERHANDIQKIQSEILRIAIETGQPTNEYKKVVELVRRGQAESARAKREMIEANLRLVIKFAKKSSNRGLGLDFSDLVQDGNIGLMKAVDKFDYRLGNKFSTYATNWIQQGISRSIADQARTIRIPVHMIDNIHKIQKASRQFVHKNGRPPTAEELSKLIGLPVDKIHKAMKVNLKPISLEAPVGTEDDSSRIEIIADETAMNPFIAAAQKNLRKIVSQTLDGLDPKEETVIRMRFGMSTNQPCTLEDVGKYLGVTRERVRQIEQKALMKLKHPTRARKLRSFLGE
jgi:RNA polymerase primary sigma factor